MEPGVDLILANRAYMEHELPAGSDAPTQPGNGGLLAAVRPLIQPWDGERGTTWIGVSRGKFDRAWTDGDGYELISTPRGPLRHRRLFMHETTWQAHYSAVSNGFFWPLLHLVRERLPERTAYYPRPAIPGPGEWAAFEDVNERFAQAAIEARTQDETCWIHDYQLALTPALLRARGFQGRIGFFLHTPFPDLKIAGRYLDSRGQEYLREFIAGMLGADLVGFQSRGDMERFQAAARQVARVQVGAGTLTLDGRTVRAGVYPVGIDVEELLITARAAPRPAFLAGFPNRGLPLVVGLERSDYTKGIPERLRTVARAFRQGLRFAYFGIAAPTRPGVEAYRVFEDATARAAADAGASAKTAGLPFRHAREAIDWSEVVALQREADVVFTSSLADGMNLVPLQAAMAQSLHPAERRAVVIAGRDAGVAGVFAGYEKDGLVPVDPLDGDQMLATLRAALAGEPGRVSDRLVDEICRRDARAWATQYLTDLERPC